MKNDYIFWENVEVDGEKIDINDYEKHIENMEKEPKLKTNLGYMFATGTNVEKNYEKAFEIFRKNSADDAVAEYNLGKMFFLGNGVTQDCKKALALFEQAGEKNLADALYTSAYIFENGHTFKVAPHLGFAIDRYIKAADLGNEDAQKLLATLYRIGGKTKYSKMILDQNYRKSVKYYTMLAEKGDEEAKFYLSKMYLEGNDYFPRNYEKGLFWLEQLAENDPQRQYDLGMIYYKGFEGKKDFEKAFKFISMSAKKRNADALYQLALMYEFGKGTTQDYNRALTLYKTAIKQGNTKAKGRVVELKKKMKELEKQNKAELTR